MLIISEGKKEKSKIFKTKLKPAPQRNVPRTVYGTSPNTEDIFFCLRFSYQSSIQGVN